MGFDGILYPSVKLGGTGHNVALTPYAADIKLQLAVVMECPIYKLRDKTVMDNKLHAILYPNQTHFELEDVDIENKAGVTACLSELGLKSLNELVDKPSFCDRIKGIITKDD